MKNKTTRPKYHKGQILYKWGRDRVVQVRVTDILRESHDGRTTLRYISVPLNSPRTSFNSEESKLYPLTRQGLSDMLTNARKDTDTVSRMSLKLLLKGFDYEISKLNFYEEDYDKFAACIVKELKKYPKV